MYKLEGIRKQYGSRTVLEIENLTIRRGELLTLLGPNGAGKSTLLRLLHFLEGPEAGEIHFGGEKMPYPVPLRIRRRIAMVFQRTTLFNRSVWENVVYGLKVRGQVSTGKVDRVMEQLDLGELAQVNARTLSGGEAQRVSLAQALVLDPDVLLLDEPTANLDPYNASLIEDIIQSVREVGSPTIVLVSHHITQAMRMADRVGVIFDGKLVELNDAHGFVENSSDPRTKAFLQGKIPY